MNKRCLQCGEYCDEDDFCSDSCEKEYLDDEAEDDYDENLSGFPENEYKDCGHEE